MCVNVTGKCHSVVFKLVRVSCLSQQTIIGLLQINTQLFVYWAFYFALTKNYQCNEVMFV